MQCVFWVAHALFEVQEGCLDKAFKTIFTKRYLKQYNNAYDDTMNNFMGSEAIWNYNEENFNSNMDDMFQEIFSEKMEALETPIREEISGMFRKDFVAAVHTEFSIFQTKIPRKMRRANTRRQE